MVEKRDYPTDKRKIIELYNKLDSTFRKDEFKVDVYLEGGKIRVSRKEAIELIQSKREERDYLTMAEVSIRFSEAYDRFIKLDWEEISRIMSMYDVIYDNLFDRHKRDMSSFEKRDKDNEERLYEKDKMLEAKDQAIDHLRQQLSEAMNVITNITQELIPQTQKPKLPDQGGKEKGDSQGREKDPREDEDFKK